MFGNLIIFFFLSLHILYCNFHYLLLFAFHSTHLYSSITLMEESNDFALELNFETTDA